MEAWLKKQMSAPDQLAQNPASRVFVYTFTKTCQSCTVASLHCFAVKKEMRFSCSVCICQNVKELWEARGVAAGEKHSNAWLLLAAASGTQQQHCPDPQESDAADKDADSNIGCCDLPGKTIPTSRLPVGPQFVWWAKLEMSLTSLILDSHFFLCFQKKVWPVKKLLGYANAIIFATVPGQHVWGFFLAPGLTPSLRLCWELQHKWRQNK